MRKTLTTVLIASFLLTGCATVRDSRLNPFNWFGRSQEVQVPQSDEEVNPLIPQRVGVFARFRAAREGIDRTTPIASVTDVRVERVPGGAILRATGLDATQGAFNVELVPEFEDEVPVNGVLTYSLERERSSSRAVGPEQSREVVVARRLSDQTLAGVRRIRIVAAQNAREVRR